MTKSIIETINSKIKELQKNLILLKKVSQEVNKENIKEDMLKYWGIERGIQISIECVIDIANIIISSLGLEKPDTYRETVLLLGKSNILPENFAKNISNMISFRNILVHDYMKIDEKVIVDILKNHLDDFVKYIYYINKWIEENYYS
ncbi:type VII toxin-antitoxin system HepT family RNase toxin [Thermoanaerobacter sp. RKWS2]|uniref:type VII toxin-antitoxin system HepT family RNase toxin n=1 Tax=Thermoanaerobacter sp. RKWS2 TaxID=2983842 RepID=UPI003A4C5358